MFSFILNNSNEKVSALNYINASFWGWAWSDSESKQSDLKAHEVLKVRDWYA